MNYYPFHIGDYATHTAHLEPLEDLAYRRLLDLYYLREGPLPADVGECARLVRLRQHADVVEAVLKEFFLEYPNGWVHERCDAELSRMVEKQTKAKASAEASVNARRAKAQQSESDRSTNAERTLNERSTTVELPTPTPTPTPNKVKSAKALANKPIEVSDMVWISYQTVRKAKRAPLTELAMMGNRREAVKAGISLEDALTFCCEAGWQAFNAEWYANRKQSQLRINPADIARTTVPDNGAADATKRMLEERDRHTAPPSAELRQKLQQLAGNLKVKT